MIQSIFLVRDREKFSSSVWLALNFENPLIHLVFIHSLHIGIYFSSGLICGLRNFCPPSGIAAFNQQTLLENERENVTTVEPWLFVYSNGIHHKRSRIYVAVETIRLHAKQLFLSMVAFNSCTNQLSFNWPWSRSLSILHHHYHHRGIGWQLEDARDNPQTWQRTLFALNHRD